MRHLQPVDYLPPNPLGLCGKAWAYFAAEAEAGTPVVSKQLVTIAIRTGFNLGNLKCELSRYNRYQAAKLAGALVAPSARGFRPVAAPSAPVVQLGALVAPSAPQSLAALFFTPVAEVAPEVEAAPEAAKKGKGKGRKSH